MIDINFLPWRDEIRKKRRKIKTMFLIAFIFLIAIFILSMRFSNQPPAVKHISLTKKPETHLRMKWVGYLYSQGKFSGLVKLPDGQTIDVQAGSIIGKNINVIRVDNTGMTIIENGKKEHIFDVV